MMYKQRSAKQKHTNDIEMVHFLSQMRPILRILPSKIVNVVAVLGPLKEGSLKTL